MSHSSSFVLSLITALGWVLIGALLAWLGSYLIAKRSGAFRKVDLRLSLMGRELVPKPSFQEVIYGYDVKPDDRVFCVLRFVITNSGRLTARAVKLRLAFPMVLRAGSSDEKWDAKVYGTFSDSDLRRTSFTRGPYEHSYYKLESLDPGGETVIDQIIEVSLASGIPVDVNAVTADGVPCHARVDVQWKALPIEVSIQAEDSTIREASFTVRAYRAKSKEEIETKLSRAASRAVGKQPEAEKHKKRLVRIDGIVVIPRLSAIPKPKEFRHIKWNAYTQEYEKSRVWLLSRWEPAIEQNSWDQSEPGNQGA